MAESSTPWWRAPAANAGHHIERHAASGEAPAPDSPLAFWALMAFTAVLLLAPQVRFPMLAPLRIALISAALAVFAHMFSRLSKGLPVIEFSPAITLVCCLSGWALVTVPFSYWPGGSIDYLLDIYFKTLIIFALLAHVINSLTRLKGIIWGLVLMAIPLALTTLGNFISGASIQGGDRVQGYAAALTANPNDMALMLNLILPLCIALSLSSGRTGVKILLGSVAALLVAAIVATFSRAGFLTLMVTGLCYLWLLRKRPQWIWGPVVLVVALSALPLVPESYFDRIGTIVDIEEDTSHSAQTRLGDMKVAVKVAAKHPLIGAGIGMNALAMNEARGATWTEVHNVYLQYAIELGLPGLTLFLLLYARCLGVTRRVLRRGRARSPADNLFFIAEGIQVSLLAFAVAALFHPVAYHFYFYYIAGLAIAAGKVDRRQGEVIPAGAAALGAAWRTPSNGSKPRTGVGI